MTGKGCDVNSSIRRCTCIWGISYQAKQQFTSCTSSLLFSITVLQLLSQWYLVTSLFRMSTSWEGCHERMINLSSFSAVILFTMLLNCLRVSLDLSGSNFTGPFLGCFPFFFFVTLRIDVVSLLVVLFSLSLFCCSWLSCMTAVSFWASFLLSSVEPSVVSPSSGWPSEFTSKGESIRVPSLFVFLLHILSTFEYGCLPLIWKVKIESTDGVCWVNVYLTSGILLLDTQLKISAICAIAWRSVATKLLAI